jgi:hypothetical protein
MPMRLSVSLLYEIPLVNAALLAQAVGEFEKARPVAGDPGMTTMAVVDTPDIRVLRDYAEPAPPGACINTPTPPSTSSRW